jgi:hypothetical protein
VAASRSVALRTVLEGDLSWRRVEVKDLRNLIAGDAVDRVKASYKRAIIVMLYAHLEGFVRSALEEYAKSINDAAIKVDEAKKQLSAACLSDSFKRYRTSEGGDPTDLSGAKARQVMRDAELIESILQVRDLTISLDVEKVCSTDSNLTPVVLRRNLAMLALDDLVFQRFVSTLDGLLKRRNAIAHGENVKVREDDDLSGLERDVFDLCETLMRAIYEAVRDESYKRH